MIQIINKKMSEVQSKKLGEEKKYLKYLEKIQKQ